MNILFVSAEFPPETGWGGIGSYVACIAPVLAARGHEVHVLSCVAGQARSDHREQGVSIHRRGYLRIRGFGRIPGYFRRETTMAGLAAFIEANRLKSRFDVVEYPERGAEGWLIAAARRVPTVAHLHTPLYILACYGAPLDTPLPEPAKVAAWEHLLTNRADVRFGSWLERFSVSRADAVTTASEVLAKSVCDAGWLAESKIQIVPCPIDWHFWAATSPASETLPVVQFCGRIERRKAPEILVDAVAMLRREIPDIQARFAGKYYIDPATRMPLMDWTTRRSFDNCHFDGHLQRMQVAQAIRSCRVLVQASRYESFGLAAAEAMAAGRPVVVTSTTGIAKIVREARAGEIVPAGDAGALANALRPYLANASYAAEVGERGRRAIIRETDPDKIACIREQVFSAAIQTFSRRRRTTMTCKQPEEPATER